MQRARAAAALLAAGAALALLCPASAQCDFSQQVSVGTYYDITNPNYPNKYPASTQCRWRASAPSGSRLRLSCGAFNLPSSTNCQSDRVRISLSGDDTLSDAHVYCGQGQFAVVSDASKLTMVLESTYSSPGGTFLCNITAVTSSSTCLCGIKKQSRVVGGQETGVNEYPFVAAIIDTVKRIVHCGATIVSAHYAVTAGHCVYQQDPSLFGLLVGDHDLTTGADTSASVLYRISKYIVHQYYNQDRYVEEDNDIALVRVAGEIAMSREVMPACLPIRYSSFDFAYSKVELLGWGSTEFGGPLSNVLLKADLYVQSPEQCSAVYGNAVSYRQMCSYNAGKDACQSDSGGPLFWTDAYTGRLQLVGVVSHGSGCATTSPGVNTRVTYYLDWITSTIGAEDQYCIV